MSRRILAKRSPGASLPTVSVDTAVAKLAGRMHLHGCQGCGRTYEDGCDTPAVNGRCRTCRGKTRAAWDESRDPRPCCADNTVLVTSSEKVTAHLLAGPGPWWQCQTCARCHPRSVSTTPTT